MLRELAAAARAAGGPPPPSDEGELESLRREIDQVNAGLLSLLERRAELVLAIGRIKRSLALPGHDPEREEAMLGRLIEASGGALDAEMIREIFGAIFSASLALQRRKLDGPDE